MAGQTIYFNIESAVGGFVWRIRRHGNHEILCSSEILHDRATCLYAMRLVRDNAGGEDVYWDTDSQKWNPL